MREKKILGIIALIVMILIFNGCKGGQKKIEKEIVKIGVILPLTGSYGEEGQKGLAAMQLAEKEVNSSIEYPIKIRLLIEDGNFSGKSSLAAYNKLLLDGVSVFVTFGTPPTQAIKGRVDEVKIPLLAMDGSSGLAKSSKWIFEFFPPLKEVGQAAGSFSKEKWSSKNMALLTMNTSGGDDFAIGFISAVGGAVPRETFESNATDVRSQILKLLKTKPEVIAVFGYSSGYNTAMNQLLESGYQGNIISDANITSITDKLRKGDRDIYFVSQSFGNYANNPESQKFINTVKLNSNIEPTLFSAYLYEMVKVIATASNIDGTNPIDIQRNILALKNHSTMFGPMTFSADGDIHLPFIVLKIEKSGIRVVETDIQ
jgi:branched-chain amino acid transport system substrate-binding protein